MLARDLAHVGAHEGGTGWLELAVFIAPIILFGILTVVTRFRGKRRNTAGAHDAGD